jgi:hypothetical protein
MAMPAVDPNKRCVKAELYRRAFTIHARANKTYDVLFSTMLWSTVGGTPETWQNVSIQNVLLGIAETPEAAIKSAKEQIDRLIVRLPNYGLNDETELNWFELQEAVQWFRSVGATVGGER